MEMSDGTDPRSNRGAGATWAVSLMGALVLYALSPAPVYKVTIFIYPTGPPPAVINTLLIIYAPLSLVADHCEPAKRFYDWSFRLWRVQL